MARPAARRTVDCSVDASSATSAPSSGPSVPSSGAQRTDLRARSPGAADRRRAAIRTHRPTVRRIARGRAARQPAAEMARPAVAEKGHPATDLVVVGTARLATGLGVDAADLPPAAETDCSAPDRGEVPRPAFPEGLLAPSSARSSRSPSTPSRSSRARLDRPAPEPASHRRTRSAARHPGGPWCS
jgi:hypothetical protein